MWAMYYVVGLGNPGPRYEGTRHNVGFEVIETLSRRHGFAPPVAFADALVARGHIRGREALLVQPLTYMNRSGDAVGAILRHHRGAPSDVIVCHDELDFEPGVVRVKPGGGAGGHNGLISVTETIGPEFARVRIGIGKPRTSGVDHVLSKFDAAEAPLIDQAVERAADAVELFTGEGVQAAMRELNRRVRPAPADTEECNDTAAPEGEAASPTRS